MNPNTHPNPKLLAFDADGVLIDYHQAYAAAYTRAFGTPTPVVDPLAYWPKERYGIPHLKGSDLALFRAEFHEQCWESMSALPGAVDALLSLSAAGYDLVCVSAVSPERRLARMRNLRQLGFPIHEVHACHGVYDKISPKALTLNELMPAAFIDDFLPYFRGVDLRIHRALLDRSPNGSPNHSEERSQLVDSTHPDVSTFAQNWLAGDVLSFKK